MAYRSASDLYAIALGSKNEGDYRCHWCDSPAVPMWRHDDPGPQPFVSNKQRLPAKNPQGMWLCKGCMLFRRPFVTVRFLNDKFKDRQCAVDHSWYITEDAAWAVRSEDCDALLERLLNPPLAFCLALTDGLLPNHLQLAVVNRFDRILADTPLAFTYNNVLFRYTVYELDDAVKTGMGDGKEAGVRELMRFLGPHLPSPIEKKREKWQKEDKEDGKITKKLVAVKSG